MLRVPRQLRDLRRVGIKLKYVLIPRENQEDTLRELKNWDLCVSRRFPVTFAALPPLNFPCDAPPAQMGPPDSVLNSFSVSVPRAARWLLAALPRRVG